MTAGEAALDKYDDAARARGPNLIPIPINENRPRLPGRGGSELIGDFKLSADHIPQLAPTDQDNCAEPRISPYGIALEQFDWGQPNDLQLQWLCSKGITADALLSPWPVGATRAILDGNYFIPDPSGVSVLTFVSFDRGVPIDIVAWQPKTGEIATYLGKAAFLGDEDDAFNPATWFDGSDLRIHGSPLKWLRHNRDGVVIVNEERAGTILRTMQSVVCAEERIAEQVYRCAQQPAPTLKVFVECRERVA